MYFFEQKKNVTFVCLALLVALMFKFMPPSSLPDYANYKVHFESATTGGNWEPFFILIAWACRQLGLAYETYRWVIFIFCSLVLTAVFYLAQPVSLKKILLLDNKKLQIAKYVSSILFSIFIGLTFILEFYFIRIRAGLSISLLLLAFYAAWQSSNKTNRVIAVILCFLAFFTHHDSFFVLSGMLLLPWFLSEWDISLNTKRNMAIILSLLVTIALFSKLEQSYVLRPAALYSNLHYVRFIMLSIIPMIIFISPYNEYHFYRKNVDSVPVISAWFSLVYAVMALGLSCYYFAGFATKSGEAIVRIFTLSSVPAIISVFHADSIYKVPLSAYLILINGLFFLATLGYLSLDIIH